MLGCQKFCFVRESFCCLSPYLDRSQCQLDSCNSQSSFPPFAEWWKWQKVMWSLWRALLVLAECWSWSRCPKCFRLHSATRCMCFHHVCATGKKWQQQTWKWFCSSEKQACLPASANRNTSESANVYEVAEAEQTHSGGDVASCFSDTLKWIHKQNIWHVMFFLCLCLASCLPPSQLSPLHGQNLNLAVNQNSICTRILFTWRPWQRCTVHV